MHLKAGVVFPRALAADTYMASLATTSYGHQIVREVAKALDEGACTSLERLELLAPFDFATESDAVFHVLQALVEPKVYQGTRAPLKHLALDATFLGDRGIEQLAELIDSHDTFFQYLQVLTVGNNFMGEAGCRVLLAAIESFDGVQVLDLSRNILTDTDALALADLLDNPALDMDMCDSMDGDWKASSEDERMPEHFNVMGLAGLRTLKLQENFITCDGFHAITIALCARHDFVATVGDAAEYNEGHDEEHDEEEDDGEEEEEEEEEVMEVEQEH
ncbi:unnamed protein product [Phytophthora fragariaefolia]|uniref:Unnamed protein product n=1 Tax=Phytophthora fragariaefolia TaxID=1490495 RepID=A0A9W6X7T3_9STRA|nr:unnamed protein product [Phytophthora fragariaefolia]